MRRDFMVFSSVSRWLVLIKQRPVPLYKGVGYMTTGTWVKFQQKAEKIPAFIHHSACFDFVQPYFSPLIPP